MLSLDTRRSEILGLMGVDIWRLRGESPDVSEGWSLTVRLPGKENGPVVVRQLDSADGETKLLDRLAGGIATAICPDADAVCHIDARACVCEGESAAADAVREAIGVLSGTGSRPQPHLVVILGEDCGRWLEPHLKNLPGSGQVVMAEDPASLLVRPECKANLWKSLVATGVLGEV
jgi:hypothetical protein